ncbi:MAG: hypothetical protein IJP03_02930, partial [Christensenellaceae bacterium]|nr:hypothetical protein [Christensenellaceae bacterium]
TFSANVLETVERLVNINYKWHLFFLVLFGLERGGNADDLESFISYYRGAILSNRSFALLDVPEIPRQEAARIRFDMLTTVSEVFKEKQRIEYLCESGMAVIHRALNYVVPLVAAEVKNHKKWEDIKSAYGNVLRSRLAL